MSAPDSPENAKPENEKPSADFCAASTPAALFILNQLTDEDADWFATTGQRFTYEPRDVLIRQGTPIDALLFIVDGEVAVEHEGAGEIARLGGGEILGEISFVDCAPPSATVVGTRSGSFLAIARQNMDAKLASDTAFAARFYRAIAMFLATRMRNTVSQLGEATLRLGEQAAPSAGFRPNFANAAARLERIIRRPVVA